MLRGLYSAASAMLATARAQEVITNNIANVNTPGFKKNIPVYQSFSNILQREIDGDTGQSRLQETFIDLAQGEFTFTDNIFDFALEGEGFFVLSTPQGIAYTRNGSFFLDKENRLVTSENFALMGQSGPLIIPAQEIVKLRFSPNGELRIGEKVFDQIRIDIFSEVSLLSKMGKNTFQLSPEAQTTRATAVSIKQKYLETSNVDIISEMVSLIDNLRVYEASQKMIQLQDNTLDKLVNEIGMIR